MSKDSFFFNDECSWRDNCVGELKWDLRTIIQLFATEIYYLTVDKKKSTNLTTYFFNVDINFFFTVKFNNFVNEGQIKFEKRGLTRDIVVRLIKKKEKEEREGAEGIKYTKTETVLRKCEGAFAREQAKTRGKHCDCDPLAQIAKAMTSCSIHARTLTGCVSAFHAVWVFSNFDHAPIHPCSDLSIIRNLRTSIIIFNTIIKMVQ